MSDSQPTIRRERTAIRRYRCSRPVSLALANGLIGKGMSVLDYGCGHGADVRYLQSKKIRARGWDPHYAPDKRGLQSADVVHLGYVLNVIEKPDERAQALHSAFELAQKALVVAVRVDRALAGTDAEEFGDGVLTARDTFQKVFTQEEFRSYLETTLGHRPHVASLGVAYVFKDAGLEQHYLATRAFARNLEYRTELLAEFAKNPTARRYVALANKLGRAPLAEEFRGYPKLVADFGSAERLRRLLLAHVDPETFAGARSERREDILTYLAMLRLQGIAAPPFGVLPPSIQQDIKACFPAYTAAREEADRFLFEVGRPERVAQACAESPVGKHLPKDLYVHSSVESEMPPLLRLIVFAAQQVVGKVDYDIVKIRTDGRAVSFLAYDRFYEDPHPALRSSVRVYLPKTEYDIRDYRDSSNPPILHRKETLVGRDHPGYAEFERLTKEEDALGLLSSPDIGYRQQWDMLLRERGLAVDGYRVIPRTAETGRDGREGPSAQSADGTE